MAGVDAHDVGDAGVQQVEQGLRQGTHHDQAVQAGAEKAVQHVRVVRLLLCVDQGDHAALPLYRAYARGFLSVCRESLNETELETLPDGAQLMTPECGARFLMDYLPGDTYFHIARPEHNLDRTRTQIRLAQEMEEHWDEMHRALKR